MIIFHQMEKVGELHAVTSRGGFLKIISVDIPTYAGLKTGFHANVSPRNWFSHQRRSECRLK